MNAVSERRDFIAYPTNRVVGTVGDGGHARAAIDDLLKAGFDTRDIDILHGEEDVKRLDPAGTDHGFLAQFQRTLIRAFDLEEFKHLMHHVEDVRAGRYVIMVLAKRRDQRAVAGDILHKHGAQTVGFYGRWAWEGLPAHALKSPQDVATAFVEAWNARDPAALASLFDEDAEFVSVTGLCWHDRASIRNGHANGEQVARTNLVIEDTKVRLLAPGVAVVHASLACDCPPADASQPAARKTIVTFVVHWIVDRWQCATAHSTDVVAAAPAKVPA